MDGTNHRFHYPNGIAAIQVSKNRKKEIPMIPTSQTPCPMTSSELDRISRAHIEFVADLLKAVQARRSAAKAEVATRAITDSHSILG